MLIVSAFVLFLVGFVIVQQRSPVSPGTSSTSSWGNTGGFLNTNLQPVGASNLSESPSGIYTAVQNLPPFLYTPPMQNIENTGETKNGFDFDAFLAELSRPKTSPATKNPSDSSVPDTYSYIPKNIISTSEASSERTESQEALHTYGNDAGLIIQLFEDRNKSMARILKDQFEDPTNPDKAAAVVNLGNAMVSVGESLEELESVPSQALSAHTRLAESYKKAGEKLALVPNAVTDEEKISAMLAYNATAEEFVRNYISLVTLFSAAGVTFSSNESGSVFTFTASSF